MTYRAPLHLAVVNRSTIAPDIDVAFWTEAVRIQLRDAAAAWGLEPPGMALYAPGMDVSHAEGMVISIVDDDGDDEAAGYHTPIGGVVDMGQASSPSRTLSHEALEMLCNARLDRWLLGPGGREYAVELCDAVQRQGYGIEVEMFGETRHVEVSNFILPSWFNGSWFAGNAPGPYDFLGRLQAPYELAPGGYAIAREDGEIIFLAHKLGAFMNPTKLRPTSRTARVVAKGAP
jgi:hypothetical protein